jgi:hypothetical protein
VQTTRQVAHAVDDSHHLDALRVRLEKDEPPFVLDKTPSDGRIWMNVAGLLSFGA